MKRPRAKRQALTPAEAFAEYGIPHGQWQQLALALLAERASVTRKRGRPKGPANWERDRGLYEDFWAFRVAQQDAHIRNNIRLCAELFLKSHPSHLGAHGSLRNAVARIEKRRPAFGYGVAGYYGRAPGNPDF
jgi:hypothetical protein